MNPTPIDRIRKHSEQKARDVVVQRRHDEAMLQGVQTQETIVKAIKALVDYLERRTGKVEVVNQLEQIGTPDALKVVDAVNELHATLRTHENTDLTEITQVMRAVLEEAQKIPKEHPTIEIPSTVAVSNLPDHSGDFQALLEAIKAIKLVAEAPVVNVPAPEVTVDAPDLTPLQKGMQAVEKAVRAIVIPTPADVSGIEKQLKKANQTLVEILDKPVGGGGGGGGRVSPYSDSAGMPSFVTLNKGSIPTSDVPLATRLDDATTANVTYIGKAAIGSDTSTATWQIAKLDTSSGLVKTWADGDASYDNVWDNRATLTYA